MAEKLFHLYDSCGGDDEIVDTFTLQGMRIWLRDLWDNNPDEEMDEDEHMQLLDDIMSSDESELCDRLGGVGYHMEYVD